MTICHRCHQPITSGSTRTFNRKGGDIHIGTELGGNYGSHLGCPTEDQILANLEIAIAQGFKPEFCRTHYLRHIPSPPY